MSNPIARLIGQAEVNLAGLSRRAVASVADPIKAKSQEVVSEVVSAATSAVKTIVIKAVLGMIAGVMLIVALVDAVGALYWQLLPMLGPVETRLVMAGIFAVIAIVALLAMVFWPTGSKAKPQTAKGRTAESIRSEAAAAKEQARHAMAETHPSAAGSPAAPAVDLKSGVETLASILGEAGFRREQAGLKTGLALASQLKPMQIVSLALVGGYIAGLRYVARRR